MHNAMPSIRVEGVGETESQNIPPNVQRSVGDRTNVTGIRDRLRAEDPQTQVESCASTTSYKDFFLTGKDRKL